MLRLLIITILVMFSTPAWALDIDLDSNDAVDVAYGGTNSTTAADARVALGLEIGVDVEAADATILKEADIGVSIEPAGAAAAVINDTAYGASWDNVTTIAPSKNALYDFLSTLSLDSHTHTGVYQAADADIPTVAASQIEMETGTEAALRSMSPLRVAQAIAELSSATGTSIWDDTARATAPGSPVTGNFYRADNEEAGWDPISYAGTTDYFVIYTGSAYIGVIDVAGNLLIDTLLGDDTAYDASSWDSSTLPPTQNAVRDKIEVLVAKAAVPWQKDIHIPAPAATDVVRFRTTKAITLSAVGCIVDPADSEESVVVDVQECDGNGASCGTVLSGTITCANTNTTGTITDTALAANVWVLIDLGTVTGTVSDVSIYIRGTEAQ